ncbi:DUF6250 domain-containing protein [Vibrio nomapromontoriensis]|uniref:DUF6250 domain-containing protein n=1 Tax=Vibrio nomapromontoriensis TaxID=2910246 RepID=UPI003D1472E2
MTTYRNMMLTAGLIAATLTPISVFAISDPITFIEENTTLIHQDNFQQGLDKWVIEKTAASHVSIIDNKLDIDDGAGVTVWFKNEISAPSVIEFDGAVVVQGGPNDRGTDLNFFWMANAPEGEGFFERSQWREGDMRKYDPFKLYYIGYGANDNSTTRFRHYPGDGTRPLLPEYDVSEKAFMNTPNVMTNIKIISLEDKTIVFANDKKLYEISDVERIPSGMFGFRTWKSHLEIEQFKVYQINNKLK